MHKANLVTMEAVKDVPPEIRPFVDFRADVEERELDEGELVAILVIDTTTSYIPVFLRGATSMSALEEMLKGQDAELSPEARAALSEHLGELIGS